MVVKHGFNSQAVDSLSRLVVDKHKLKQLPNTKVMRNYAKENPKCEEKIEIVKLAFEAREDLHFKG